MSRTARLVTACAAVLLTLGASLGVARAAAQPAAASPAAAQVAPGDSAPPLASDRPGFLDASSLVPPGMVQGESGYTYRRTGAERGHTVGEAVLCVGMWPAVEGRLVLNSYQVVRAPGARQSGLLDPTVGAKVRLSGAPAGVGWVPEAALVVATSVPLGGGDFSRPHSEPSANVIASWPTGRGTSVTLGAGAARRREDGVGATEVTGGALVEVPLAGVIGAGWDGYAQAFAARAAEGAPWAQYANVGVTRALGAVAQADVWTSRGFGAARGETRLGVGLVRRW